MKSFKFNNTIYLFALLFVGVFITSCEPQLDDKESLGDPPGEVTFDVSEVAEKENTFLLTGTTPGAFIFNWDLGNGMTANGNNIEVQYPKAGTYDITLEIVTDGGIGESSVKTVTVDEDLPISCEEFPLFEFLSNCDSRTWRLVKEEGAYWVGPNDNSTTWYQNPAEEVEARPCAFNDEWIFTVDEEFTYDTKGDVWAEDYFGFNFECVDESELSDVIRPWGSGVHSYSVDADGGPTFTVFGQGAFMGLPKASNGQEVTTPVNSNTYTVSAMETQVDRLFLELQIVFGDGYWRFRFESDL